MRFFDVLRLLLTWALTFLSLLLTAKLLPGFTYTSWLPLAAAAAVAGLVGMIVRPVLVEVAAAIGWVAVAAATLFGQAIVMQVAMDIVPGASFDSFGTAVAAAWLTAAFSTLLVWLVSAGTDESFAASLLRIKPGKVSDPEVDGVVFVQLDGVSFPVMQWVLQSGTMPTLRRWLDTGSHAVHEWTVQLPCTTPASQQAILQGSADGIPAFRWYDRDLGRVLVANRPDDASIIESRASTGRGLLADDGVSVSNLFTGDAAKASHDHEPPGGDAGVAPHPPGVRTLPASGPTAWCGASPARSRRWSGSGSRRRASGASTSIRGCTARGRSPVCAPSATACCVTSTPPW